MKNAVFAFISGALFGFGLIVSEMINPMRVKGFLDVAGLWDPTLVFVMVGALMVVFFGYRWIFSCGKPLFEVSFSLPAKRDVDGRLILGAVLFGIGWGLSGLCPGPAIVGLATFNFDVLVFVVAMILGMKIFEFVDGRIVR